VAAAAGAVGSVRNGGALGEWNESVLMCMLRGGPPLGPSSVAATSAACTAAADRPAAAAADGGDAGNRDGGNGVSISTAAVLPVPPSSVLFVRPGMVPWREALRVAGAVAGSKDVLGDGGSDGGKERKSREANNTQRKEEETELQKDLMN